MASQIETMREQDAARALGVSVKTLQKWRHFGGGPNYIKISSRCVRYRPEDLAAFLNARVARSTSDRTQAELERDAR
jgi:predicted site-specific integrase-resolvase